MEIIEKYHSKAVSNNSYVEVVSMAQELGIRIFKNYLPNQRRGTIFQRPNGSYIMLVNKNLSGNIMRETIAKYIAVYLQNKDKIKMVHEWKYRLDYMRMVPCCGCTCCHEWQEDYDYYDSLMEAIRICETNQLVKSLGLFETEQEVDTAIERWFDDEAQPGDADTLEAQVIRVAE